MKLEFSRRIFEEFSNMKFHENPSAGADCSMRPDGEMDGRTDRQTDMTKLIVAFRNFAKAPNKIVMSS
jgi:hypothetical protein